MLTCRMALQNECAPIDLYIALPFLATCLDRVASKAAIFSRLSETSQLQFALTRLSTVTSALVWSLAGSRGNLQKSLQNTDASREPE